MAILVYGIGYWLSFLFDYLKWHWIAGLLLIGIGIFLYYIDYKNTKNMIHLRGLFSVFFIGGQGIACLKLSNLQTQWSLMTWICLFFAYAILWATFEGLTMIYGSGHDSYGHWRSFRCNPRPIFHMICGVTAISTSCFLFEAFTLGYVPLFLQGVPHAYSEFHLSGVHYFTVSCVLVPALGVLFFYATRERISESKLIVVIVMVVISLLIPILCVSRFQFVFAVALGLFTYIALQKHIPLWYFATAMVALVIVYLILSVARSHDVEYLNGIFEMKSSKMPIFISQPYIYVANNYENFNVLVESLPAHSFGMKGLFPIWALTGLKFIFPQLVNYPIYINKDELTTVTMFYDAYYDFGVIGVIIFAALLGVALYALVVKIREMRNPVGFLLYAQFAVYVMLSFFTTWFSNPTTWFYLVITCILGVYYTWNSKKKW